MDQCLDEACELAKQVGIEAGPRSNGAWRTEVGPFKEHGEATALNITQYQRVDSADPA
jgi:hypothetical protein